VHAIPLHRCSRFQRSLGGASNEEFSLADVIEHHQGWVQDFTEKALDLRQQGTQLFLPDLSDGSERYHRFLPYLVPSTHPTSNDYKFTIVNLDNLRVENKNGWNMLKPLVLVWVPWIPLLEWTSTSSTKNRTVNLKKKRKTLRMERFKQPGQCWRILPASIRGFQVQ
jgi:hypothetical protein